MMPGTACMVLRAARTVLRAALMVPRTTRTVPPRAPCHGGFRLGCGCWPLCTRSLDHSAPPPASHALSSGASLWRPPRRGSAGCATPSSVPPRTTRTMNSPSQRGGALPASLGRMAGLQRLQRQRGVHASRPFSTRSLLSSTRHTPHFVCCSTQHVTPPRSAAGRRQARPFSSSSPPRASSTTPISTGRRIPPASHTNSYVFVRAMPLMSDEHECTTRAPCIYDAMPSASLTPLPTPPPTPRARARAAAPPRSARCSKRRRRSRRAHAVRRRRGRRRRRSGCARRRRLERRLSRAGGSSFSESMDRGYKGLGAAMAAWTAAMAAWTAAMAAW